MICSRTGSAEAVKALLAAGADKNAKEPLIGQTALMWALAEHHNDVAKALIDAGADKMAHTNMGSTPMHFAAREEHRRRAAAARVGCRHQHQTTAR